MRNGQNWLPEANVPISTVSADAATFSGVLLGGVAIVVVLLCSVERVYGKVCQKPFDVPSSAKSLMQGPNLSS